jgi:peroxiredoxin Q/BCP
MSEITIGKPVPDFELPATGDKTIKLSDYRGKPVVLYFYPKASTPGCTQEGLDFTAAINKFRRQSTVVLGASRDSVKAQENFKAKQGFPFDLLSDKEETLCNAFDVVKMKNMYGKQVRGVERSTFLIDEEGVLRQEWRKVTVKGHVDEVLEAVKTMRANK